MIYSPTKFEVATSNGLRGDKFTRNMTHARIDGRQTDFDTKLIYPFFLKKKAGITKVKVTQNVAQYPLHHVTYSATKFEVATSNRLGGDTFTRKYNI